MLLIAVAWSLRSFCFTCLVILSILFNTSGDKFWGIKKPYDVFPSRFANDKWIFVSSSLLDKNKNRVYVWSAKADFNVEDNGLSNVKRKKLPLKFSFTTLDYI